MSQTQTIEAGERTQCGLDEFADTSASITDNSFPPPTKPRSAARMVQDLLSDADFCDYIRGEVLKARAGDRAASARLGAHFKPLPTELTSLRFDRSQGDSPMLCTDLRTTTFINHLL